MKKIMFIIAFLGIISMAGADEFSNPIKNDEGKMTAKVITPLQFWDVTPNSTPLQGEVIKGTVRTYVVGTLNAGSPLPAGCVKLFEGIKEANETASVKLTLDNNRDGVKIKGSWYFLDKEPASLTVWPGGAGAQNINSDWIWWDQQTHMWLILLINEVDATGATSTGLKTFTATITGQYTSV